MYVYIYICIYIHIICIHVYMYMYACVYITARKDIAPMFAKLCCSKIRMLREIVACATSLLSLKATKSNFAEELSARLQPRKMRPSHF